jgi:hypothetical protein
MIWLVGSSPFFLQTLGCRKVTWWAYLAKWGHVRIGSFVNLVKYGMLSDAKYGMVGGVPSMVCCG